MNFYHLFIFYLLSFIFDICIYQNSSINLYQLQFGSWDSLPVPLATHPGSLCENDEDRPLLSAYCLVYITTSRRNISPLRWIFSALRPRSLSEGLTPPRQSFPGVIMVLGRRDCRGRNLINCSFCLQDRLIRLMTIRGRCSGGWLYPRRITTRLGLVRLTVLLNETLSFHHCYYWYCFGRGWRDLRGRRLEVGGVCLLCWTMRSGHLVLGNWWRWRRRCVDYGRWLWSWRVRSCLWRRDRWRTRRKGRWIILFFSFYLNASNINNSNYFKKVSPWKHPSYG